MRTNEKLLAWRLDRELSQREAADLAELSQPTWQSYEAGTSVPKVKPAERIEILTRGSKFHIRIAEWGETDEQRAVRKARAATRRVHRTKPRPASNRRTGTDD